MTSLESLFLLYKMPSTLYPYHLTGLNILILVIDNEGLPNSVTFDDDFLQPLKTLIFFMSSNVNLPPMSTNATKIVLKNGVSLGDFGECSKLTILELIAWEVKRDVNNWLEPCRLLKRLRFEKTSITHLYRILQGSSRIPSVRELSVKNSALSQFPFDLLLGFKSLEHLDLSNNHLQSIQFDDIQHLGTLKNLTHLNLSRNRFFTAGLNYFLLTEDLLALRELNISSNPMNGLCGLMKFVKDGKVLHITKIESLSLADAGVNELCFSGRYMPRLEYMDLKNNQIRELQIEELPSTEADHLVVELQGNPIYKAAFQKEDYELVQNKTTLSRWKNTTFHLESQFDCDCENAWFAKALREGLISVTGAVCPVGTMISLIPAKFLECTKTIKFGCTFRRAWIDGAVIANCNDASLNAIPIEDGLKELYIANNNIERIHIEELPDSLQLLDIRQNRVSRVEPEVAKTLFDNSRRLLLDDNPLLCDCENKYFITKLQEHKYQVEDYDNLTCAGVDLLINDVVPDDLCFVFPVHIVVPVTVAVALVILCFSLYRIYEHPIKVFLFIHGLCLYCIKEDDIDSDCHYDAFIAFSHHDHEFVAQELLPKLDPDYKICVHYRDWIVGEWIPNQVENSILHSRKTIIILSKDYVESTWGMFEFRMAHTNAVKEGRTRIIIVVLDDVIEREMAADLRHFVSNNTYLKWGDPWFWKKLYYALPHKSISKTKTEVPADENNRNNMDNLQMRTMMICEY
ncbi:protein toll-like [Pectinophora gossypiella]|uniref:protein toll-like n=1 Tax=Pectinophora gossypiella TaxID=13191 RepID=UPI00214E737A|nr:protein toll-like [Pectinophora gossypiella]